MKRKGLSLALVCLAAAFAVTGQLQAQGQGRGHVVVPDSSVEHAQDHGVAAHTNHLLFVRDQAGKPEPQASTPSGMFPATIRSAYNFPAVSLSTGGSGVIAIVDAYDYATAQHDFDVFASQFGLPLSTDRVCNGTNPCFVKVLASSGKTRSNCGWGQEAALDIEWAHAMAPYAQIVLVEAKSNSFSDLFAAVDAATQIVQAGGYNASGQLAGGNINKGQVSMSWGGSEFSSEASNDTHFPTAGNVVYFASSGDTGGAQIYPSASPNVIAAGGTSLKQSGGTWTETAWSGSGGGPSKYEALPSYQSGVTVNGKVLTVRGIPDLSFDADPNTGVAVYDSTSCQGYVNWMVFGGTSVSSPSLAGVINAAGGFAQGAPTELSTIYSNRTNSLDYRDVVSGTAGSFSAYSGWDYITGVGSPLTYAGK